MSKRSEWGASIPTGLSFDARPKAIIRIGGGDAASTITGDPMEESCHGEESNREG